MSVPLLTLCLVLSAAQCRAQAADTSAIDFSLAGGAAVDPETGAVCVEREEEVERVEQLSEQQCTQQTVTQVSRHQPQTKLQITLSCVMCTSATTATTPSTVTWCGRSVARSVPAIV